MWLIILSSIIMDVSHLAHSSFLTEDLKLVRSSRSLDFWDSFEDDYYNYNFDQDEYFELQGSALGYMGRIEVALLDGTSGSICGVGWDRKAAAVICRELGMDAGAAIATNQIEFGLTFGPVVYTNVQCSGNEFKFADCKKEKWDGHKSLSCPTGRTAGVVCGCKRERAPTVISRCFLYTGFPRDDLFCQFKCPRGMALVGESRRHCDRMQTWSDNLPICIEVRKSRPICMINNPPLPCLRHDLETALPGSTNEELNCIRKGCCYNTSDANTTIPCYLPGNSICSKLPCKNGGKCRDYQKVKGKYVCLCDEPYYGEHCEFKRRWSCGVPTVKPKLSTVFNFRRIVGGHDSKRGSWPWIAQIREKSKLICSATLIHPEFVITAAHCASGRSPLDLVKKWTVVLGQHTRNTLDKDSQIIGIDEIYTAGYTYTNGFPRHDMALLKLKTESKRSINIEPVCLPSSTDDFPDPGTKCWIIGWGQLAGNLNPKVLQEGDVPIMTNKVCRGFSGPFNNYDQVAEDMFCAGYNIGGVDACSGDSGGPMLCQRSDGSWYLSGIISWGYKCGDANSPGVYTRVASYVGWISQVLTSSSPP